MMAALLSDGEMMTDFVLASAHHIALLLLVALLASEAVLLSLAPSGQLLKTLGRIDGLYGLSAVLLLLIGSSRLEWGAKGFSFYSGNWVFWTKIGLFVLIGLISITPTLRYIRWRRAFGSSGALPDVAAWAQTRKLVMAQLHLLPFVALAAAAMARGIGH
jgi:putative membrane protein